MGNFQVGQALDALLFGPRHCHVEKQKLAAQCSLCSHFAARLTRCLIKMVVDSTDEQQQQQ
jgi:hypothetical protein